MFYLHALDRTVFDRWIVVLCFYEPRVVFNTCDFDISFSLYLIPWVECSQSGMVSCSSLMVYVWIQLSL